jgi:hypothetical protein
MLFVFGEQCATLSAASGDGKHDPSISTVTFKTSPAVQSPAVLLDSI